MALMLVIAVLLAILGWGLGESFAAGPAAASLVLIPVLIWRAFALKRELDEMNERNSQAWLGLNARMAQLEAQLSAFSGAGADAAQSPAEQQVPAQPTPPMPAQPMLAPSEQPMPAPPTPAHPATPQAESDSASWTEPEAPETPRAAPIAQPHAETPRAHETYHFPNRGEPFEPAEPFEQRLKRWLVGDNPVARAGVVVLLIGVALLLRLAAEHGKFPIEARLGSVALLGMGLVAFGYRQRGTRRTFSQLLQGAGIAALYLTVFFGYRVYQLLPSALTFGLLVTIVIASGVLAVLQNALALVFVGTVGGFAAPILASSGSGNYVALFSYYLVLNLLVLGVAWFKDWRLLSMTGFIATYGVGTAWGVLKYSPENFASVEPFLIAFFCIYVALNVLSALRRPESLRGLSSSLTFGLPLVTIALQVSLAGDRDWIVAVTALTMGALYYGLARVLIARKNEHTGILVDSYTALAVGLATLSVPYALDSAAMTAGTWILEAGGLYWVGMRSQRWLPRLAAFLLLGIGFVQTVLADVWTLDREGTLAVLNPALLCAFLIAGVVLFTCACALHERSPASPAEQFLAQLAVPAAMLLWAFALFLELHSFEDAARQALWMALCAISAALLAAFGNWKEVTGARWTALGLLPLAGLLLAFTRLEAEPLWLHFGALAWPVTALAWLAVLHAQKDRREAVVFAGHALTPLWLVALGAFATWDVANHALSLAEGWSDLCLGAFMAASVIGLRVIRGLKREPLSSFPGAYRQANDAVAAVVLLGFLLGLLRAGNPSPLPFIPLLNPLELTSLGLWLLLMNYSSHALKRAPEASRPELQRWRHGTLGTLAFVGVTTILARGVSYSAEVPYQADALWQEDVFQVGLSILWTLIGLGATTWASVRKVRSVWIVGAALLGVVVVKLFWVDLGSLGQLAKIGSFIGVGLLLLVVSYLAPLPPAREQTVVKPLEKADGATP